MAILTKLKSLPKPQFIVLLIIIFILLISAVFIIGSELTAYYRSVFLANQEKQFAAPEVAVKRQVKRVMLKRELADGSIEYIEIFPNGTVNIYDGDMNLIKSGLQGFYRVNLLYNLIDRSLDDLSSASSGQNTLTIETNQGTVIIILPDDLDDLLNEIVDDIEDIAEDTFSPTPTFSPTHTPVPGQPTATPLPSFLPTLTPSPIPVFGGSPTPTPLPDYMTAPPFTCEDYADIGRPVTISNISCGNNP